MDFYNGVGSASPGTSFSSFMNRGKPVEPFDFQGLVTDSESDSMQKAVKVLDSDLSPETKDFLLSIYGNDYLSERAYHRELEADSDKYQRARKDLQAAGLNPFLAFDSIRGGNVSSSAQAVGSGYSTSKTNNDTSKGVSAGVGVLSILAIIVAAAMKSGAMSGMAG